MSAVRVLSVWGLSVNVARRTNLAFAVIFVVALCVAGTVYALARRTGEQLEDYRVRTDTLQTTMWSLRSDFYNYDDQMNMYVAVLLGNSTGSKKLAETTYQQAFTARTQMGVDLGKADGLATNAKLRSLLTRVRNDFVSYTGFADQTRAAATAGDLKRALYIATIGNLVPSNDMMPTLDAASALVSDLVGRELRNLESSQQTMQLVSVFFGLFVLVVLALLRFGLQVFVLSPVGALRDRMAGIATGVLPRTTRVDVVRPDEFGQVAGAFNSMLETLSEQEAKVAHEHATRELESQMNADRTRAAERSVRHRAQVAIDENSAAVVEELNNVMSEVEAVRASATIIDSRVSAASSRTRDVVGQAKEADRVVTALGGSLRRVGGMAQLIASVADQTKLLALNATIEAARAGEAGHGFSVVAGEVKDLATTTAQSTAEISSTIGSLEGNAAAMTTAIIGVTEAIAGVEDATAALGGVAADQHQVVQSLQRRVAEAISRIDSMGNMTERLERRRYERIHLATPARLTGGGQSLNVELMDISASGARCALSAGDALRATDIRLQFEFGGNSFDLKGSVVRKIDDDDTDHSFGIEFTDMPEADRRRLESNVAHATA